MRKQHGFERISMSPHGADCAFAPSSLAVRTVLAMRPLRPDYLFAPCKLLMRKLKKKLG